MATNGVDFSRLTNVPEWKHPFYVTSFISESISPPFRKLLKARIRSCLRLEEKGVPTIDGKEEGRVRPDKDTTEMPECGNDNMTPLSKADEKHACDVLSGNVELEIRVATLAKIEKRIKEIETQIESLDGEKHALFLELKKTQDLGRTKETRLIETKCPSNTRAVHNSLSNSNTEITSVNPTVNESKNLPKNHRTPAQTSLGSPLPLGANYQPSPYSKTELKTFIDRSDHSTENSRASPLFHDSSYSFPRKRNYSSFYNDSSDFRSNCYSHGPLSTNNAKNGSLYNHPHNQQHTQRFINDRIPSSDNRDLNDHKFNGIKKEIH